MDPASAIAPFCFVLIISLIREAIEDIVRIINNFTNVHRKKLNTTDYTITRFPFNTTVKISVLKKYIGKKFQSEKLLK